MGQSTDETILPLLGAALNQTRSATCITTAQLDRPGPQIVYVNPAYCEMAGRTAAEVIGQTPRIMQGPLTDREVLDRLRSDLEAGRPFVGETINYHKDGSPFLISWRIDPVLDRDGNTTHYIATQENITRLRRAERLLAAERAIDRCVSTLLSRAGTTAANLGSLVDGVRDAVAGLIDHGEVTVTGSVRLGTSQAALGAGVELMDEERILASVARHRGAAVSGTIGDQRWLGCSLASERGGVDGAVIVTGLSDAQLDFVDVAGLERAGECARRAIDSLAEYERQRMVAVELQRDLLPGAPPELDGLRLAARYQPGAFASRVGGDWYDVFTGDGRVVLIVGDMAGSGIRAAADMGRVRLLTRLLLQQGADVPEIFLAVNRFCADEDLVATALAVTLDTGSRTLTAVTAGHPPPVVRRTSTAGIAHLRPGPLLGIGGQPCYPPNRLDVAEGDVILMFTDGLIERPEETIDASLARLVDEVLELPPDTEILGDRLIEHRLAQDPGDDIAVLAAQLVVSAVASRGAGGS
jgi:PAS domain S-box-containing protein